VLISFFIQAEKFYKEMEEEALRTLEMLALIQPPADDLLAKAEKLKAELEGSKTSAQARVPNKEELALGLLHGVYGVVDLAEECAARGAKHSRYVPTKFCVQGEGKGGDSDGGHLLQLHLRVPP
jgi:hypothetical protein